MLRRSVMRPVLVLLPALRLTALPVERPACLNKHPDDAQCDDWAAKGECEANAGFMKRSCARSCDSCSWERAHCSIRSQPPAKRNGGISAVFESAQHLTAFVPTVRRVQP